MWLQVPFILIYRFLVWGCFCLFTVRNPSHLSVEMQFDTAYNRKGGWWRDYWQLYISTRDTFYILMALRFKKCGAKELSIFVQRLAAAMTNDGQIPYAFHNSWYHGEIPMYEKNGVRVIDANMQFIILTLWLYEYEPKTVQKLYLHCQRAWQWLDICIANDKLYEQVGGSWEDSRYHKGTLLLSNVVLIETIRCMELLHMYQHDGRRQKSFQLMHERCLTTWIPEIYKTQEVLPRILAVHFGMVPRTFIKSFNQELQCVWIPCRTEGPIENVPTTSAWVHGSCDKHDTVVWPWIGMLWMMVLHKRMMVDISHSWWISYIEFHNPATLYDMYSPESGHPLRRAFLKAQPCHSLTIAMQIITKEHFKKV